MLHLVVNLWCRCFADYISFTLTFCMIFLQSSELYSGGGVTHVTTKKEVFVKTYFYVVHPIIPLDFMFSGYYITLIILMEILRW